MDQRRSYNMEAQIMLVLSRRLGEAILIADNIRVTVTSIRGAKVRLGIEAPRSVEVSREEVAARRDAGADSSPGGSDMPVRPSHPLPPASQECPAAS
jgi:carbon storage regulator